MTDLNAILTAAGLTVVPQGRWQDRKRPGTWAPVGVMVHHTAGRKSLNVIIHGRSDLPGPLANLHIPKDGTVNLVSAGRCNHAGGGSQVVLDRVRRDLAPLGDAGPLGYPDGPVGNGYFYGLECENLGDGRDPWPAGQLDTIARAAAALCRHHGWSASRVVAHREWSKRKPDPRGVDMGALRRRISILLTPAPNPEELRMKVPGYFKTLVAPNGGWWHGARDGGVYTDTNGRGSPAAPFHGSVPGVGGLPAGSEVVDFVPHLDGYAFVVRHTNGDITGYHFAARR